MSENLDAPLNKKDNKFKIHVQYRIIPWYSKDV